MKLTELKKRLKAKELIYDKQLIEMARRKNLHCQRLRDQIAAMELAKKPKIKNADKEKK
jgi:hypothetical protein